MSKLPVISGREGVKALGKVGFYFKRQEGSHIILRRNDPFAQVAVPNHKELDRGTLRAIRHIQSGSQGESSGRTGRLGVRRLNGQPESGRGKSRNYPKLSPKGSRKRKPRIQDVLFKEVDRI